MDYIYDASIVVVNYNGKQYLNNLFESLKRLECDKINFEVVFVDNQSTDGSVDYIKYKGWEKQLPITIVENNENQGFAEGNNTGVRNAKGKYIVFLNNDTAVDSQWLKMLYNCINSNQEYGMVASKLLFFYDFLCFKFETKDKIVLDKKIYINEEEYNIENKFCKNLLYGEQITAFGHTEIAIPLLKGITDYKITFNFCECGKEDTIYVEEERKSLSEGEITFVLKEKQVKQYQYSIIQNAGSDINSNYEGFDIGMGDRDRECYNICKEINSGCGAAIIMRKVDFEQIGGFDERFFMYYEDTDLSFRVRKLGKKIIYCPDAVVRHIHTGSSKEWSPFFAYHVYRNKLLFVYKNVSFTQFLKQYIKLFASAIKRHDKIKFRSVVDVFRIIYLNQQKIRY